MNVLAKPAATLTALAFGILVFGAGLTSPIWLIVAGSSPLQAIQNGTPIVVISILGLALTVFLGVVAARLQKPRETALASVQAPARNHHLVHIVVLLMFIVPFLTIILGFILKPAIDFEAGG